MDYVRLGSSGLEVSPIAIGCMTFGEPDRGYPSWSLDEESSRPLIRAALEAGVNFFDTANGYSTGSSEEILGRALKEFGDRDELVIGTKVHAQMRPGPHGKGLSRKAIMSEIDASLRRLGTDYIDLYQIHRFDHSVPPEETLETLHDVVKAGKARYLGASSMHAWEFSKLLHIQDTNGWSRFISMQNHHNLLNREEEREMQPLCVDSGVGTVPWSPLARGLLSRPVATATERSAVDPRSADMYPQDANDVAIINAVVAVAAQREVSPAQVALAWLRQKPAVTAPIVGVSKEQHLKDAVQSISVVLSSEEIGRLEAPYVPRENVAV